MKKIVTFAIGLALLAAVLVRLPRAPRLPLSITSREAVLMSEDGQIVYENNAMRTKIWFGLSTGEKTYCL